MSEQTWEDAQDTLCERLEAEERLVCSAIGKLERERTRLRAAILRARVGYPDDVVNAELTASRQRDRERSYP